jgi:hypothetical protein
VAIRTRTRCRIEGVDLYGYPPGMRPLDVARIFARIFSESAEREMTASTKEEAAKESEYRKKTQWILEKALAELRESE